MPDGCIRPWEMRTSTFARLMELQIESVLRGVNRIW